MPAIPERRSISIRFASLEEFQKEYSKNIANGGVFVPCPDRFVLRDLVTVVLDLSFRDTKVSIDGEVVSVVPGSYPGVALQFSESAPELRTRLGPFAGIGTVRESEDPSAAWRKAARHPIRICVYVEHQGKVHVCCTQNVSRSGVLVAIDPSQDFPVGSKLKLRFVQPLEGQDLEAPATVVRKVTLEGGRQALGINFDWPDEKCQAVTHFITRLELGACGREGADITGAISSLGVANIVQMLASCCDEGTLSLRRGDEGGRVIFREGNLLEIHCGDLWGIDGLAKLCTWKTGTFSYGAEVEHLDPTNSDEPISVYGALLEAAARHDEHVHEGPGGISHQATLKLCSSDPAVSGQIDEALVELAQAGFDLKHVLEIIPEDDAEIMRSLTSLCEQGIIKLES